MQLKHCKKYGKTKSEKTEVRNERGRLKVKKKGPNPRTVLLGMERCSNCEYGAEAHSSVRIRPYAFVRLRKYFSGFGGKKVSVARKMK